MTIPYTILGGYLGAGKTTLLNHLLAHNEGLKIALLINDFGAINIDAKLIASKTDGQINLTNGCVCCGLSDGFDTAIGTLLEREPPPDRIIVEASGVADVVSLAQYGHHPGLVLDGVLVVADAETVRAKARDKYVAATVTRQLKGADLILLNKTDLVSAEQRQAIESWLSELAPDVPVVPTSHCDLPTEVLLGLETRSRAGIDEPAPSATGGHESYATWHLQRSQPLPLQAVEAFISALPAAVLRAKGFFQVVPDAYYLYQQVGGRKVLESVAGEGPTELVVIGLEAELRPQLLDDLAESLFETS